LKKSTLNAANIAFKMGREGRKEGGRGREGEGGGEGGRETLD